jgi:hypothetical protein
MIASAGVQLCADAQGQPAVICGGLAGLGSGHKWVGPVPGSWWSAARRPGPEVAVGHEQAIGVALGVGVEPDQVARIVDAVERGGPGTVRVVDPGEVAVRARAGSRG